MKSTSEHSSDNDNGPRAVSPRVSQRPRRYRQVRRALAMPCLAWALCCASAAEATLYEDAVLADLPVTYWQFEDASSLDGAAALDAMGTANGIYQDGVTLVAGGIGGQSARLNGTSAGIDLGYALRGLLDGAGAISVEAWIRNDTLPTVADSRQWIFATRIDDGWAGVDFGLTYDTTAAPPDETFLRMAGRSTPPPTDSYQKHHAPLLSTEQWRHVVGINDYANDEIRLFIDGALALQQPATFNSDVYNSGTTQSQRDQVGRAAGGLSGFFDGLLDEVAVYDYALDATRVQAHFIAGNPTDPPPPPPPLWKSQVAFSDASTGVYLGSPSVARIDETTLVASLDYFGPNAPKNSQGWLNTSAIYRSTDNGDNWSPVSDINNSYWPTVFEHDGSVYLIGESARYESIVIRESTDGGLTWSEPTDAQSGLLRQGGSGFTAPNYFSGNNNVLIADGKIYRSFSDRTTLQWADGYETFLLWADLGDDLLDADSWNMTNKVALPDGVFDAAGGVVPGWQEGSVVQAPDGQIQNVMRVNVGKSEDRDTAAILKLSPDGTTLSFDIDTGFIDMPGASAGNFIIRRDPKTGMYLSLVNNIVDPEIFRQRNYLSLAASEDLINWRLVETLLSDDQGLSASSSAAQTGFQYVHWQFDGDDLNYIVRTAYDGANNYHDSNRITYQVLSDYESLLAVPLFTWSDTTLGGTNFNTPTSWSPAGPPTPTDNATIENGGTALVDSTNTGANRAQVKQLTLGGAAAGSVSVSGMGDLAVAADLNLGLAGTGTLTVSGSTASVTVGENLNIGSTGTLAADISGPTHSTISVTGNVVHLGGTLDVTFSSAPLGGAHLYTLATGTNYTGTFTTHNVPFPVGAAGDAIGRVTPIIYTSTSVKVGLVKPGDADFSSDVTAGGDGSILLGNLGPGLPPQGSKQWIDADFDGDGSVTAGDDGSILLGAVGSGPYDAASAGSAQVTFNPATGHVSINATGVALIQLVSAAGNFVPDAGTLVDGFLVGAVDNPDASDLTFISLANNLGTIAGFTAESGYLLAPGTPANDLTLYYQHLGGTKVQGAIVIVPEPSTLLLVACSLLSLILCACRRTGRARARSADSQIAGPF